MNLQALRTPIARIPDVLPPVPVRCRHLAKIAERDRILHLVQRRPGITAGGVAAEIYVSTETARDHLRVLLFVRQVRMEIDGRHLRYFARKAA